MQQTQHHEYRHNSAQHIHKGAVQCHLQIADATEESLDSVGHSRQDIHPGDQVQITDSERYHLRIPILGEQSHDLRSQAPDHRKQTDGIDQLDQQSCLKTFLHALFVSGALVLRQESRHGMSDVLLRRISEIIHAVHCGKCCHNRHTLSIDY